MTSVRTMCLLVFVAVTGACAGGTEQRFAVPAAPAGDHIGIAFGSVVVRDVSLPDYAASQEIFTQGADGALTSSPKLLWADEPARAITLELARHLTQLTGARVASEPWPFTSGPDAAVEVRVEQLMAGADGTLRMSGQYFVASESGRARSKLFDLSVPVAGPQGAAGIAAARGRIVRDLARAIASDALR